MGIRKIFKKILIYYASFIETYIQKKVWGEKVCQVSL